MQVSTRDLDEVLATFGRWFADRHPELVDLAVTGRVLQGGGYSNDVFFLDVSAVGRAGPMARELVLRLPPVGPALFREYDLALEAAVQQAVAGVGVPVPSPLDVEQDESWFGVPFVCMPRIAGRAPSEVPLFDPWIAGMSVDEQRALQGGFLDAVARIHTTPWAGTLLAEVLRGAGSTLAAELDWWDDLVAWTFGADVPPTLAEQLAWCRSNVPADEPDAVVLWGDVRLGNTIIAADATDVVAVLDWEMAAIGPPEHDIAWYTALTAVGEHFMKDSLPGFRDRAGVVAHHEAALGRPLVALEWFERFALCRAALLNLRTEQLAAEATGRPPVDPEANPVLTYLRTR